MKIVRKNVIVLIWNGCHRYALWNVWQIVLIVMKNLIQNIVLIMDGVQLVIVTQIIHKNAMMNAESLKSLVCVN